MRFSKISEKFDRVLAGRSSIFDVGSSFLKTGVTSDFLSISGKMPLLIVIKNS